MRNAQTSLRMETPLLWMWMCLLQMETLPLRMGDVPFVDGNAAARTFGRAHRRRPYHFWCGSVFQGRRRTVRRRTKTRKGCRRTVCRWTKTKKGCRRGARRRTKTRNDCRRIVRRWTNTRNDCRRTVRRWTKSKKVAGEQFADDILRCLSQEKSSPPIFRTVYRRKRVRRRYSVLFIAGKQFAADIPRRLSQENSSPPIFRTVYRRKTVRR